MSRNERTPALDAEARRERRLAGGAEQPSSEKLNVTEPEPRLDEETRFHLNEAFEQLIDQVAEQQAMEDVGLPPVPCEARNSFCGPTGVPGANATSPDAKCPTGQQESGKVGSEDWPGRYWVHVIADNYRFRRDVFFSLYQCGMPRSEASQLLRDAGLDPGDQVDWIYLESLAEQTFSLKQVVALCSYFSHWADMTVEAYPAHIPQPGSLAPHATPVGGLTGIYGFCQEDGYSLDFDVAGYYDLRQGEYTGPPGTKVSTDTGRTRSGKARGQIILVTDEPIKEADPYAPLVSKALEDIVEQNREARWAGQAGSNESSS